MLSFKPINLNVSRLLIYDTICRNNVGRHPNLFNTCNKPNHLIKPPVFPDIETLPADTKFYDAGALTLTCIMKSAGLTVSGVTWARNGVAVSEPAYTSTTESGHLTARLSINEVNLNSENCHLTIRYVLAKTSHTETNS